MIGVRSDGGGVLGCDHRGMRTPILLCYDGSTGARRAIEWAGSFLRGWDAVVLHLWDSPAIGGVFAPPAGGASPQRKRAVAIADEGVELARSAGLQPRRLVVGTGVNWQSILLVAEEERARMIVLGASGAVGLVPEALGSVSQGVAQHARIPVIVVPPATDAEADGVEAPASSSSLARVLSQFSGTRDVDALARYVMSESRRGRALSQILDDSYVRNRADTSILEQLFDRKDVVDALGLDAVADLRSRIAAAG